MSVTVSDVEYEDGSFADFMEPYAAFVDRGVSMPDDTQRERLLLGTIGLNTEAGEAGDELKKYLFHGKPLDYDKLTKELGDVLWYYQLILSTTGISLDEVIKGNVEKLTARYPEKHGA